ncbi:MAG: hypothetical protein OXH52_11360 [Gammaproteobacteria bacterium]|nr:hypothetical protein [Gammaproteobacteria bacterium]
MVTEAARIAEEIAGDFYGGGLDLSARGVRSAPGWADMPEVACAGACRRDGVDETTVRRLLTLVSAMDRARDAERLWRAGYELLSAHPEAFDPSAVAAMPIERLSALLAGSGVSQRHGPDSRAWQTISRSLTTGTGSVRGIVEHGSGDADALLVDLRSVDRSGQPKFPLLRGPKVGPMWVRIMANPGGASVHGIERIPVAVDVHVRRVTRNLGVAATPETGGKRAIEAAWHSAVSAGDVPGPSGIEGTCAGLDPALWFYGKHGCRHCETVSRPSPIGTACRRCVRFKLRDDVAQPPRGGGRAR